MLFPTVTSLNGTLSLQAPDSLLKYVFKFLVNVQSTIEVSLCVLIFTLKQVCKPSICICLRIAGLELHCFAEIRDGAHHVV